jgi:NurA domain
MKALQDVQDKLLQDFSSEISLARSLWNTIIHDEAFLCKIQQAQTQLLVPTWQGKLDQKYSIQNQSQSYTIASVDGSQIYPDKHQGTSCFLVNIGLVAIFYGHQGGVKFDTEPYVFVEDEDDFDISTDLVNCRRQEFELDRGLLLCKDILPSTMDSPFVFLFDGSLIFWHLQAKDQKVKDHFMLRYLQALDAFYQQGVPIAGYISLPKSKELVNLLRLALCDFNISECEDFHKLDHIVDATIARFFLNPGERTEVFAHHSPIVNQYPDHLKPYFFYADFGYEIGRIEIPAWIAGDNALIEKMTCCIYDQVLKGYGYPVVLAEAHEQAVVKGPDREFFYHLIQKLSIESSRYISISQKSSKKRKMAM